jgi:hypothetical protein
MVAEVAAATGTVLIGKLAEVAPNDTVTVFATETAELSLLRLTAMPLPGASPLSVTVPVAETPPVTLTGSRARPVTVGALTVSVAVFDPLRVPVIVAVVLDPTGDVVTPNVVEVAPPGTFTLAGTVAGPALLSVTAIPPVGAGPLSVTVPVEEPPPSTAVGLSVSPAMTGGLIVRTAVFETAPRVAVIVGETVVATAEVEIVNVAVVWPAATVTLPGTMATVLLLPRVTATPPVGAGPSSVTVPVAGLPPVNTVGLSASAERDGALTVRGAVFATPPADAVMVGEVVEGTAEVEIVNVAVVCPAVTVTDAGTVAAAVLLLLRVTTIPPAGAAELIVTVPVEELPPMTVVGLRVSWLTACGLTVSEACLLLPL